MSNAFPLSPPPESWGHNPCDGCGLCCAKLWIEIDAIDLIREPRLWPVVRPMQMADGEPAYAIIPSPDHGGCPLHDPVAGRCTIHPTRPNVCVVFKAGGGKCQSLRHEHGLSPIGLEAWPTDEAELTRLFEADDDEFDF